MKLIVVFRFWRKTEFGFSFNVIYFLVAIVMPSACLSPPSSLAQIPQWKQIYYNNWVPQSQMTNTAEALLLCSCTPPFPTHYWEKCVILWAVPAPIQPRAAESKLAACSKHLLFQHSDLFSPAIETRKDFFCTPSFLCHYPIPESIVTPNREARLIHYAW